MKKFLLYNICLLLCLCIHAVNYTPQSVFNPKTLGQDSYVSNADGILTPVAVENINQMCITLQNETKVELAVVAIDNYDGSLYDNYNFAVNLFNYWGIGDKKASNGILVLLVTEQQVIRIATGSRIDNILTDNMIITNCILMGRLEAFAMQNKPWPSFLDGVGNGLGYAMILVIVGAVREFLGRGSLLGFQIIPDSVYDFGYVNNGMMTMPAMALILVGCVIWVHRAYFYKEK